MKSIVPRAERDFSSMQINPFIFSFGDVASGCGTTLEISMATDTAQAYLSRKETANYCSDKGCPISPGRLARLAIDGGGPPYRRWGHRALYRAIEVDSWIEQRLSAPQTHTSGDNQSAGVTT